MIGLLATAVTGQPASADAQQAVGYPSLFLLISLGSLIPVVPTGALVSGAAVVAFHESEPMPLVYVFVVSAVAAFLGDIALYWLGLRGVRSRGGSRWLQRLQDRVEEGTLDQRAAAAGPARCGGAGGVPADTGGPAAGDGGVPAGEDAACGASCAATSPPAWPGRRPTS